MNFFVNLAMGMGNSGVEHAQFYRAKRFDQVNLPYRFVFMELINNLHDAMDHWDIHDEQVINLWEYLVLGDEYALNGLQHRHERDHHLVVDYTKTHRMQEFVTESGLRIREYFIKKPNPEKEGFLLVSTDRVEIFDAETGARKVSYRIQEQPKHEPKIVNIHVYELNGHHHLYFENLVQLNRYFFKQLDRLFPGENTFIIDRGEDNEVALLDDPDSKRKLVDVVHADHLSDRDVPSAPLWNNYYEYVLTHLDRVDRLVVATKLQRKDLLIDFPDAADKIVTIPVGGVSDDVQKFTPKKLTEPLKLITVSRLAEEKHIDLIVRAVAQLRAAGHPVTLDIFGQGSSYNQIADTIKETGMEQYVVLKGMTEHPEAEYPKYDAFVSASYSEGFGLTFIEAMNAALPVVTFKARFGAMELVHNGKNGFALAFRRDDDAYNVKQLVKGIEKLLAVSDYQALQENVVKSVKNFRDQVIADKWRVLIDEL